MRLGRRGLPALALALALLAGVGFAAPQAHAKAAPGGAPTYLFCSRIVGPYTKYAPSTANVGNDTARGQISVWYDAVCSTSVCQDQAGVLWTTTTCSGRSIDVFLTNGVGGHNSSTLQCGTQTYYSAVTYSDVCTYSMEALTSDSYTYNWDNVMFC